MSISPNPTTCCILNPIPTKTPSSLLTAFTQALSNIRDPRISFPRDKPCPPPRKLPNTIIELEIRYTARGRGRRFAYYYFVPRTERVGKELYDQEAYRAMYPEECFERIEESVVEKRWKGEEEWWKKQESLSEEKGERVSWQCEECRWMYFVRVLEFEDVEDVGEESLEESDSDDTFVTARTEFSGS